MRAHGLDGTLRIQSLSDNPTRFQPGEPLTIGDYSGTVASYQAVPNGQALLRLQGLANPNIARAMADQWIFAPVGSHESLEPGEYYHYQLIGISVVTDEGESLGTVREIIATGSNDVYVVRPESGPEILLPAISQVVQSIDLASETMLVHLLDGLR